MDSSKEIARKREILSTFSFRFSSKVQPLKEDVIARIIEQSLLLKHPKCLSLNEIHDILSSETWGYVLSLHDIQAATNRLVEKGMIIPDGNKFRLSDSVKRDLEENLNGADKRFKSVVRRLFKDSPEDPSKYEMPFLNFLCIVFSQLGDQSVKLIKGIHSEGNIFSSIPINAILKDIGRESEIKDHLLFENASVSFFRDSDPEYDSIKWNMAQNYYITKALGLDPSGSLLSEEVFKHSTFYLDTNIIISALEPKHKHHKSFVALNKACKRLDIQLKICQISLQELTNWVLYQRELIQKVDGQIPEKTAPLIRSEFYESYCEMKKSKSLVNIDDLFINFKTPIKDLKGLFDIELVDNHWFDTAEELSEVKTLARNLRYKYLDMRGRLKAMSSVMHDAKLIVWVEKNTKDTDKNAWLISADTSLVGSFSQNKPVAIMLDAFLQWVSPIAFPNDGASEFSSIFAEMIKYRILPQDRIFNLEDFVMFHDLNMSCKQLPAEDVEGCIRYIKVNAPTLDPTAPADREKLSYEISKYFADPGRKYKEELSVLEKMLETERENHEKEKKDYESKFDNVERGFSDLEVEIKKRDQEISNKKEEIGDLHLKLSAFARLIPVLLSGLVFFLITFGLINNYGDGNNWLQKVSNSWGFFSIPLLLTVALGWLIIGKEKIKALGSPFVKFFKQE